MSKGWKRGLAVILVVIAIFLIRRKGLGIRIRDKVIDVTQSVSGTAKNITGDESGDVSSDGYAYSVLTNSQRTVYKEIDKAVKNHDEMTLLSTSDAKLIEKIYQCVMADNTGYFWVHGYSYTTTSSFLGGTETKFYPKYLMTKNEAEEKQKEIDAVASEWLSGISTDTGDYEKSKYVYELLANNVDYDYTTTGDIKNQTIESVFLKKSSVCQGFADATTYLLKKLGVSSCVVIGKAYTGEAHAWNLVRLDGKYYYLDSTWGNGTYKINTEIKKHINYAYLNSDYDTFSKTHIADDNFAIPKSNEFIDNYYVKEGLYFPSEDRIGEADALREMWDSGGTECSMRFGTDEAYLDAFSYLVDQYGLRNTIPEAGNVSYTEDKENKVLTFVFDR